MGKKVKILVIFTTAFSCATAKSFDAPFDMPDLSPSWKYVGPSTIRLVTTKALLGNGVDDQFVALKGRLVRHIGGRNYLFSDESGNLIVWIDPERFTTLKRNVDENTLVELRGQRTGNSWGAVPVFEVIEINIQ
ncbi:YgiW/YdeI family stress tolerance OB fold protein [Pandoraea iniqua]|uniref:YgiW/YdeI family stress tolerance OB fold protein n=1 Tax=Pandoraea iniqua TaxID=2508288 RepID=UPI001581B7C1|nr:NirD/YgiW/YdeI family stress tolerance protein [Pandoraea iniqua]